MHAAAESGDAEAIKKVKAYKEANRIRSADYFRRKQDEKRTKKDYIDPKIDLTALMAKNRD